MSIAYLNALAGAGKTRSPVKYAHRMGAIGQAVALGPHADVIASIFANKRIEIVLFLNNAQHIVDSSHYLRGYHQNTL